MRLLSHTEPAGGPPPSANAGRSLTTLLKRAGLARLEPIFFGEMLAHSYSVNRLLALNATSIVSCGSDGLVVLWKDGRHQCALRSRLAAMHLASQQVHDEPTDGEGDDEDDCH